MKFKRYIRNLTVATVLASSMTLSGCSTDMFGNGSAVSTLTEKLAPVDAQKVKLFYSSHDRPKHYKVIGRVAASTSTMIKGVTHSQETIAAELKKQAGSIGANGVINIHSGEIETTGDAIILK